MSLLLVILLFVLLWYVLRPLIKTGWAIHKLRRGDLSGFADLFGQPGRQQSTSRRPDGSRRSGWTSPRPRRKKIPRNVGEYVRFTEVTSSETHTYDPSAGSASFTREDQVTDAEWVDLPSK